MPEWKLHTLENTRIENAQPVNARREMTEKSYPGKCQRTDNWISPEWKIHTPENARMDIASPGK